MCVEAVGLDWAAQKSGRASQHARQNRKSAKLAGETTRVGGMAGRYATALFELARDENKLDETEQALSGLSALLAESEDLASLVRSPIFSAAEQSRALAAIAKQADVPALTSNFLQLLVRNRRLFALRQIIAGFRNLAADYRGELTAEVTSAVALSKPQSDELKATLKAKTGRASR